MFEFAFSASIFTPVNHHNIMKIFYLFVFLSYYMNPESAPAAPEEHSWAGSPEQTTKILITAPHAFCPQPTVVCDRSARRLAITLQAVCAQRGIGGTMLLSLN